MHINRFHWGISHYIGSQLRQCVLDPDGETLYAPDYPRRVPPKGRRLHQPAPALEAAPEVDAPGDGTARPPPDAAVGVEAMGVEECATSGAAVGAAACEEAAPDAAPAADDMES